ncbi:MAG: exodeoxyribonuclease V subunit beta [Verrucomicrobia bacterium]|nr:exodeoxyribonuclease V subunit beta [Verrucomicrobiota bacterium]
MKTLQPFQIENTGLAKGVTLIEASAGTGKTFTIAGIILRLILELRIPIEQILTVTYTVAATEELRDRVRKRLRNALDGLRLGKPDDDVVAKHLKFNDIPQGICDLDLAIQNFDDARIFTIHAFCQRVLRDYAFESGILFDTELLPDPAPIFEETAEDFWRRHFYSGPAFLPRLAMAHGRAPTAWTQLLWQTLNHPDLEIIPPLEQESAAEIGREIETKLVEVAAKWSKSAAAVSRIISTDQNLSRDQIKSNFSFDKIPKIEADLNAGCTNFRQANPEFLSAIERASRSEIERCTKLNRTAPRHPFFDLCEEFRELTTRYFHQLDHEFIAFAQHEIPRRKARLNVLTYDDLLTRLRDALRGEAGQTLAKALGAQYRAALIDEFQDTDPVQYEIFRRIFSSGQHYLFFVSDPKQAIYAFRGADVYTYLRAASQASRGFTLDTNFRSEKPLLDAVNTLFTNVERPFLIEGIEYRPVHPPKKIRQGFAELVEPTPVGPFRFRLLRDAEKPYNQTEAELQISDAVLADIARLQASGSKLANRPLRFSDMAVLVRSNAQAANLQKLLRAGGIKSVLQSEESVFKTNEARELLRFLQAVLEPGRDILLRTALSTSLVGLNAAEILSLDTVEAQWQHWLEKFLVYRSKWEESCFIALFRYAFVDQNVRQRVIQYPGGERILTNFLHIAELLHRAETDQRLTPNALCDWLQEQISRAARTNDEHQLRLESDDDAVLLTTVHKSKGLEYPIVFCPFLWKAGDSKIRNEILFHDPENDNQLTLDLRKDRPSPDHHDRMAGTESMAESVRTLYVALTRAQNRCYVYTGDISKFDKSPLAQLLGATSSPAALRAFAHKAGGAISVTIIDPAADRVFAIQPSGTQNVEDLSARTFSGTIPTTQMITSFTGLTAGRAEEEPDRDAVELVEPAAEAQQGVNVLAGFERGFRAGVFLHDVLEHLNFQAPDQIDQLVRLKLAAHGIKGNGLREALCAQLRLLLETPLETPWESDLTLSRIPPPDKVSEVEFSHPIVSLRPDQLQKFFVKHGGPELPSEFPSSLGRLNFRPVDGFMRGFIDLLFRFRDHYYIVDWKSNWLGDRPSDYDEAGIRARMLQHSYFLQYHLYTVAADLYLSRRISGYEYDKHFGGVFYAFFRGLDLEKSGRGIFHHRPSPKLINALRQLLIDDLS